MPRSVGFTGCRKGRDSGSCLYRDSRVGINACRNSSGLKTGKRERKEQETKVRDRRKINESDRNKRNVKQTENTYQFILFLRDWGGEEDVVPFVRLSSSSLVSVFKSVFLSSVSIGSCLASNPSCSSFLTNREPASSSV